ncbi:hypothetical protein SAZ11_42695 [Streptomyces sp. FXJ1.4098]|nr:hypothetical protein [Streptomyces sp. FXJ1.4098]
MVHAEWVLATLDGHGLDPTTVLDLHVLLYSYVQGIAANLEQEAQAEAATGLSEDEWMDRQSQALQAITTSPATRRSPASPPPSRTATTSASTNSSNSAWERCSTGSRSSSRAVRRRTRFTYLES